MKTQPTPGQVSMNLLQRHLSSFQNNDLEGILSDFTEESVLVTHEAIYLGLEEIRGFFAGLISFFPKDQSSIGVDRTVIRDELVYIIWHAKTPKLDLPFATDTIIVKDGKIRQQTFAGHLNFLN